MNSNDQSASEAELLIYEVEAGQGSPEALFEGTLAVDENGGHVYGVLDNGTEFGIIFPDGTEVTRDGAGVKLPGGTVISWNEEVALTGGYTTDPRVAVPAPGHDEYFLVADAAD